MLNREYCYDTWWTHLNIHSLKVLIWIKTQMFSCHLYFCRSFFGSIGRRLWSLRSIHQLWVTPARSVWLKTPRTGTPERAPHNLGPSGSSPRSPGQRMVCSELSRTEHISSSNVSLVKSGGITLFPFSFLANSDFLFVLLSFSDHLIDIWMCILTHASFFFLLTCRANFRKRWEKVSKLRFTI